MYWEGVLRAKLPNLSAADLFLYKTGDGMSDVSWTANLADAVPILVDTEQAGMTGMTYIEGLHRYVMVAWHLHQPQLPEGG